MATLPRLPSSVHGSWTAPVAVKKAQPRSVSAALGKPGTGQTDSFSFVGDESIFSAAAFVSEAVGIGLDVIEEGEQTSLRYTRP